MMRLITIFILVSVSAEVWAQEYRIDMKARLRYSNNDVSCDSWFEITLHTQDNDNFEWYQGLNMGEDNWAEFEKSISVPAGKIVTGLTIRSKRQTENISSCKTRAEGTSEYSIPDTWYPCNSSGEITGLFNAYDGESSLEINITPLSLGNTKIFGITVRPNAIQTEAAFVMSSDAFLYNYTVTAVYTSGSEDDILTSATPRSRSKDDAFKNKACLTTGGRNLIKEIRVFVQGILFSPSVTKVFPVNDTGGDLDLMLDDSNNLPFPYTKVGSYLHIRYNQPRTPINYSPGSSNILPSGNKINLQIPESNNDPFQWQYSVDGGSTFNNVPASFGNTNTISFSGEDLFGSNWSNYLFKNIFFKALYTCASNRETKTITLVHLPSAPGISSVDPVTERCAGVGDGGLKINFKRPLYTFNFSGEEYVERVYIFLQQNGTPPPGETHELFPNTMAADNSLTILNLANNTYHITLLTSFVKKTDSNSSLGNGYSDGPDHAADQTIVPRPPIANFNAAFADVHCYGGEDGKITVSAEGGTKDYTAYLLDANDTVQTISLNDAVSNSFNDLKPDTYSVRLKDSNGCDPKESNGPVRHIDNTIHEPLQNTSLSTVEAVEPLGFGLQNGYITVRSENGTSPYTFAWKDSNNTVMTPEASVTEGTSMTSKLSGIGKGTYFVRAQDTNYALAFPQTEVNLRGCYDTLSIILDQPPLLEVATEEFHFVSCYGYDDGKIVAHATGGRPYLVGSTYRPYQYEWYAVNGNNLSAFGVSDSIATDRPSAIYRVKVTDRNGISAWSSDFMLVQPDPLKINFVTSELLCNGDTNGTSKANVQGGTGFYKYAWSTEDTTSQINNLVEGWYSLIVTDVRHCTTYGQTEVIVPNSLKADSVLDYPTCNGYIDGSIEVDVSGGHAPYSYAWTHGPATATVSGLGAGDYHVRITDANHCFIEKDYSMQDPALVPVDLGPDRVLCKGQTLDLNVTLSDPTVQYAWMKNGAPFASTPVVQLTEAGSYHVTTIDSNGCKNEDDVKIERDDTEISSNIIVATRAPLAGTVRVANISFPASDSVKWIIPAEATIMEKTSGYIDIKFNAKGKYTIGLTGYKGLCEKTTYDTIRVVDKNELTDYQTPDEPYIKQFLVTPNPNDGRFTATVELRESGNYQLIFLSPQGVVIMRKEIRDQQIAKTEFDVTSETGKGVYVLQLVTSQGYSTFKVVIQ
jgi:hypothetical protein